MDTLNEHYFDDNDRINRVHERKLVISYDYRNSPIYHYILLQLVKHPKCCIRNFYETENGDWEVTFMRFNAKGEIHIDLAGGYSPENWHSWPKDTDYSNYNSNSSSLKSRPSICDISYIQYTLNARGPHTDIEQLRQSLSSKIVKTISNDTDDYTVFEFVTEGVSPVEFNETHVMKYTSCFIEVFYNDTTGVEGKIWGLGNKFYEFKLFTKTDEQTLDDFSKKD
jgi:hypothetical protein